MTKTDLAEHVREMCPEITLAEAKELVGVLFALLKARLAAGERVKLSGFGIFTVAYKRTRRGRNPLTGDMLVIGAHRAVRFKPSPTLTGVMNGR